MDENYTALAVEAAIEAGAKIMEVYNTSFDVIYKADASPLTEADQKANACIMTFLESTNIPIISEENKAVPFKIRKEWPHCWVVDPLDGTKEFIKKNGEFTVNIAYVKNGIPQFGVIYAPVLETLYFTDWKTTTAYKTILKGLPKTWEVIKSIAKPIEAKKYTSGVRHVVGSRSHLNADTKAYLDKLGTESELNIVSKGSSLKFCLVAEGAAHEYPRFAPTMEWDTAAGQAICMAAGAKVLKMPDRKALTYNRKELLNPHFLVTV